MSCCHSKELDEYETSELEAELERRQQCAAEGRCVYCGKFGNQTSCRMHRLHADARRDFKALKAKAKA